jgi:hypothetical protein
LPSSNQQSKIKGRSRVEAAIDRQVTLIAKREGVTQTNLLSAQSAREMADRLRAEGWTVTLHVEQWDEPPLPPEVYLPVS